MAEGFVRHKQPWTSDEIQKLHRLAAKGMALKAIGKAMTRSEESIQARAKLDGLKIAKLRYADGRGGTADDGLRISDRIGAGGKSHAG